MSDLTTLKKTTDSADKTKLLFNNYNKKQLSYPSAEVDAVVGFFEKRGFEKTAAFSVASVILEKAKQDGVRVFSLLETLEYLDKVKLSNLILNVLNSNRSSVSKIGYKTEQTDNYLESRNIIDANITGIEPLLAVVVQKDFSNDNSTFDLENVTWDGV